MINEYTILMILTWLKEKESLATKLRKQREGNNEEDNEKAFATFLGLETAYSNAIAFIEALTGIKLTE